MRFKKFSFNSLQTGRCIQSSEVTGLRQDDLSVGFQFPSNGKVYPKIAGQEDLDANDAEPCFNSLQTGRCIQSCALHSVRSADLKLVSIPFKREGVSKDRG